MFILKKIVARFILPPGLFSLILLTLGIWSLWGKQHRSALVCLAMALLIWLPALDPVADLLLGSLEKGFAVPAEPDGDVIIMLGGGAYSKVPDLSGKGAPGPGTMTRMVTAARLQRRLNIPIIVSGGAVFKNDVSVGRVAQRFLIDLGIPPTKILLEDQSRDTYENATFSRKICRKHGFDTPLLVTSGYHLKRAVFAFDKAGLDVIPIPCGLTTWPDKSYSWRNFLPNSTALYASTSALHEWLGLLFYRMVY